MNFIRRWRPGVAFAALVSAATMLPAAERPNIILMMVDDMGWSDIGCYGGEVDTPNLNRLAAGGLRFTQFYNTGRCCPTRASLLTGLYPHQAGVGWMTDDWGEKHPGYRGRLSKNCVTIGEVLREAGYLTITTGKWHVGHKDSSMWPVNRGFDRSYSVPAGAGFYYRPTKMMVENDRVVHPGDGTPMPDDTDWYATDAWVDKGLEYIDEAGADDKPFFWYLAFNAPHWPLQADEPEIARYRDLYRKGWDVIRAERHARQVEASLLDDEWKITARDAKVPAWEEVNTRKRKELIEYMACYAATIDRVDQAIGRLLERLQANGKSENTLIMFLADNGGCAEGGVFGGNSSKKQGRLGSADSFIRYGLAWANASNTPFRRYKHWVHEGGISTPLIVHWPRHIKEAGSLTDQPGHVIDLMATCVDVAGAKYPTEHDGQKITPIEGLSLTPVLRGEKRLGHEAIFWEHEGNRAVRAGNWKLVAQYPKDWELYNLAVDRTETNNLADEMPERVESMRRAYRAWRNRSQVEWWGNRPKKNEKK